MTIIENKTHSHIIIGIFVFLMMSFFFFPPAAPIVVFLLAIFVFSFSKNKGINLRKNLGTIFLFSAIFWVYLAGMLITQNVESGWNSVLLKFSFLVFPLIFGILDVSFITKKHLQFLMGAFIFITSSSIIFSIFHAAFQYVSTRNNEVLFYSELSYILHPSYYALYINFALIVVLCRLMVAQHIQKKSFKILHWLLIPLYIGFLILLESKAGLIGLISVLVLSIIHLVFTKKNYRSALKLFLLSLTSISITILLLPQTTSRVNQIIESMEENESAAHHSASAARIYLWKAALNSIMEKPVFGHGTGDTREELMKQYQLQKNTRALEMKYDAHNQYLQGMVATGILGLLSLVFLVGFPMLYSLKDRILLYFLFGFLMAINLLVESMFERQAGVMFYAFFNSLYYYYYKNQGPRA
jgi:O-antigen ligase